jgi:hypothetical protein
MRCADLLQSFSTAHRTEDLQYTRRRWILISRSKIRVRFRPCSSSFLKECAYLQEETECLLLLCQLGNDSARIDNAKFDSFTPAHQETAYTTWAVSLLALERRTTASALRGKYRLGTFVDQQQVQQTLKLQYICSWHVQISRCRWIISCRGHRDHRRRILITASGATRTTCLRVAVCLFVSTI